MISAWDRWFLMRCPLLWQLRLHWYLPLALLWCLLTLGGWIGWLAQPALWQGSTVGAVSHRDLPEQQALNAGTGIALIVNLGLALWWLSRVRIHNRWRKYAPASSLSLWWEYLWGALFFGLLLTPTLLLMSRDDYSYRLERQWQGHDVAAQQQAARYVQRWEQLLTPYKAARLTQWALAPQSAQGDDEDTPCNDDTPACTPRQALNLLVQGDTKAISVHLAQYGSTLGAWGYTAAQPVQEQARQLIASYQAALQSPLAREWQAYKARNATPSSSKRILLRDGTCDDNSLPNDPRVCFAYDLTRTPKQWEDLLSALNYYNSNIVPRIVLWTHPRYGTALPGLVESHLERVKTSHADRLYDDLINAASRGFLAALALVIARLLSLRQITALCMGLTLAAPLIALLGVVGLPYSVTLPLLPAALLALAWVRIVLLRRPWGGSTLLGLGMVLSLFGWAALNRIILFPEAKGIANVWLTVPTALCTTVLMAALSPLWRRWRALPER